jgi:hypothetical protein
MRSTGGHVQDGKPRVIPALAISGLATLAFMTGAPVACADPTSLISIVQGSVASQSVDSVQGATLAAPYPDVMARFMQTGASEVLLSTGNSGTDLASGDVVWQKDGSYDAGDTTSASANDYDPRIRSSEASGADDRSAALGMTPAAVCSDERSATMEIAAAKDVDERLPTSVERNYWLRPMPCRSRRAADERWAPTGRGPTLSAFHSRSSACVEGPLDRES